MAIFRKLSTHVSEIDFGPLFDPEWYLATNKDVREAGIDPLTHFKMTGWAEGRKPHSLFDTEWYLATNPDVEASGINPLTHYIVTGWKEGRKPNRLFDVAWYLDANPDICAAAIEPLTHYIQFGAAEGREPLLIFDTAWYKNQAKNIEVGTSPLAHYVNEGWRARLDPHPLFDVTWYRKAQTLADDCEPLGHFIETGGKNSPHPLFDATFYLRNCTDMESANLSPLAHYLMHGFEEGRQPHPLFDVDWYRKQYPDVVRNRVNPLMHYLTRGWQQGLKPHHLFDTNWYFHTYADVNSAGKEPLAHYVENGGFAGFNPSPQFDSHFYLTANSDVRLSGINPLAHYVLSGQREGRKTTPDRPGPVSGTNILELGVRASEVDVKNSIQRIYDIWPTQQEAAFKEDLKANARRGNQSSPLTVSVILPTFNRADSVAEAIESVIRQTYPNWKLFIVDDGSSDGTEDVVASYLSDPRVKYIKQKNSGVASARNTGLSMADGDFIAYLDSDNRWRTDHLESIVHFMDAGNLDAAYCGIRAYGDDGSKEFYRGGVFSWSACLERNYIDMNTFVHRRSASETENILFDETLRRLVDWDFILRVSRQAKVSYAPYIGVDYYHGSRGDRITLTEYADGQLAPVETSIRDKHLPAFFQHENVDAFAWHFLRQSKESGSQQEASLRLRFFPDYRINNAYQSLLYSEFGAEDVSSASISQCVSEIERVNHAVAEPHYFVFHLHWTNPIFASGRTAADASRLVDEFIRDAKKFRLLGGKIYWTVHNILSHEPKYREQELRLANALCELADQIHVHDDLTVSLASAQYVIPIEKVIVAEHGNYIGTLPHDVERSLAREKLGLPADALVFCLFGQLRPYKGLDDIIPAFEAVRQENPSAWLVLAGKPLSIDVDEYKERLSKIPNVVFHPAFVPDDEVQLYLKAADVAVLPYRQVLTSGSALLALSFSLPVIAPDKGLLGSIIKNDFNGFLFDPSETLNLETAMREFALLDREGRARLGANAFETAMSYRWTDSSRKLLRFMKGESVGEKCVEEINGSLRTFFVREGGVPIADRECCAIILHYNSLDDTRSCVESCISQGGQLGIVVVSNADSLEDAKCLHNEFPDITIIQSEDNIGYAAGNNLGLSYARQRGCDFFWILNPDVVVPGGYLAAMLRGVRDYPATNLFGSPITYGSDESRVWYGGGVIGYEDGGFSSHRFMGDHISSLPTEPYETDYVTGANIFGRMRVLDRIGYIPEDYFLYFEETDWFANAAKLGERAILFPSIRVTHWKRSEVGGLPTRAYCYYFVRNAHIFGQRYATAFSERRVEKIDEFIEAWSAKIRERAPDMAEQFSSLFARANADGLSGVVGPAKI
ncbi:glycosyltransferase [Hyphomonas sp.]|uniref:glycosyltransferase n=1 Tax=Hyphomonas sp. TaxID=87 RepID=UPI003569609D